MLYAKELHKLTNQIKNSFHWPSLMWFSMTAVCCIEFLINGDYSLISLALGFAFLGYSSINILPNDFFTRKLELSKIFSTEDSKEATIKINSKDVAFTIFGFLFLLGGLIF